MQDSELQYYLERLDEEDAFFTLIEAGDDILPLLETQFRKEASSERRAVLIRIIGEHRNPQSLALLSHALADTAPSVWQAAINGIVTIGGAEAAAALHSALSSAAPMQREWINEALSQVRQ